MLAATVRVAADLDLAEECVQTAFARALTSWEANGVPDRPGAWLTTTARNVAIDQPPPRDRACSDASRCSSRPSRLPRSCGAAATRSTTTGSAWSSRAATPRSRCRAGRADAAARLRAEHRRGRPRVPGLRVDDGRADHQGEEEDLPGADPVPHPAGRRAARRASPRCSRSSTSSSPPATPRRAARTSCAPTSSTRRGPSRGCSASCCRRTRGVAGLLALILLTDARRAARVVDGDLVLLADQDRSSVGPRGHRRGQRAGRRGAVRGPAVLLRAHGGDRLEAHPRRRAGRRPTGPRSSGTTTRSPTQWPSPVVSLNRAVASASRRDLGRASTRSRRSPSDPRLATYPYLAVARAEFCRQLGDDDAARTFLEAALALTGNDVQRSHLERQLADLER